MSPAIKERMDDCILALNERVEMLHERGEILEDQSIDQLISLLRTDHLTNCKDVLNTIDDFANKGMFSPEQRKKLIPYVMSKRVSGQSEQFQLAEDVASNLVTATTSGEAPSEELYIDLAMVQFNAVKVRE